MTAAKGRAALRRQAAAQQPAPEEGPCTVRVRWVLPLLADAAYGGSGELRTTAAELLDRLTRRLGARTRELRRLGQLPLLLEGPHCYPPLPSWRERPPGRRRRRCRRG